YHPAARRRYAYVSGYRGDGGGQPLTGLPGSAQVLVTPADIFADAGVVANDLTIAAHVQNDPASGSEVRAIDLSSVPANESTSLRVRIAGVGVSARTAVGGNAARASYVSVARG